MTAKAHAGSPAARCGGMLGGADERQWGLAATAEDGDN